jgi:hypothetical protein
LNLPDDHLTLVDGDHAAARARELGPVKQDQVAVIEANPAHGITDHDQLLRAHGGWDQLAVQVDLIFDVIVGRTGELAVGHTRWTDPSG